MPTSSDAVVDPRAAEELLGLPFDVPIRPLEPIDAPDDTVCLARFNGHNCDNGRPFGIDFDLSMCLNAGRDPNEVLLHELVHAWQWFRDARGFAVGVPAELAASGYDDAAHEVEARDLAAMMNDAGVRVFFPSPELAAELHAAGIPGYGPDT